MTLEERFWSKVDKTDNCWLWTGYIKPNGYGTIRVRSNGIWRNHYSHRVAYELDVGFIDKGLTIDHLCRNRSCVNPDHLEAVTNRENILRGTAPAALHAVKTHCPKGHPYNEANTRIYRGSRHCKECNREHHRQAWGRHSEKYNARRRQKRLELEGV